MYSQSQVNHYFNAANNTLSGEDNVGHSYLDAPDLENDDEEFAMLQMEAARAMNLTDENDDYSESEAVFERLECAIEKTESESNDKKKKHSMKHFDYYLSKCGEKYSFTSHKTMKYEDINKDLVGKYTTYLGELARQRMSPNLPLLKYLSALGYLSAFKCWCLDKWDNHDKPKVFEKDNWKRYLRSIRKMKLKQARLNNEVCFYILNSKILLNKKKL